MDRLVRQARRGAHGALLDVEHVARAAGGMLFALGPTRFVANGYLEFAAQNRGQGLTGALTAVRVW
jgi:hypothetical protein